MYNEKNNTKKHNIFKKKKSELGLDPPTHFRVFLGFLDFFNLTKPFSEINPLVLVCFCRISHSLILLEVKLVLKNKICNCKLSRHILKESLGFALLAYNWIQIVYM